MISTKEELENIYLSILNTMKSNQSMSDAAFDTWFNGLKILKITDTKVVFGTQDQLKRKVLASRYIKFIEEAVEKTLGFKLETEIICDLMQDINEINGFPREPGEKIEIETSKKIVISDETAIGLCSDYTFENFVVGSSNQLAHACSINVSKDPGGPHGYNPLFIYGPSGLGKTHLMYAIANRVHTDFPSKKIICIKSEEFLNEMIECITKKDMQAFRDKYRSVDLLLIDDIQFISGKKSTQEEFFHTFEALQQQNSQIVLTSDRPPKEMFQLEERIQTRFEQGMIVDVQPPEYELRIAIIKKKAQNGNIDIPTDVLAFLAEKLNSNIREIEGAIKKIGAVAFLKGVPITLDMVKSSIPEYFKESKPVAETVDSILEVTARKYDVKVEDILGKSRTKDIKTARNVAMYIIKKVLDLSLPNIGKMMNRDHSTVHSNIQAIETEIQTNDKLNNNILEIIAEIKSSN